MHRRLLVAAALVGLLAGLAGCADVSGSVSMEPVDDETVAEYASQPLPNEDSAPGADKTGVARRAIENGSASTVALGPPVESGLPFRHDGRFYDLSYEVDGTEPGHRAEIEMDYNASSVDGAVVAYEDLPAVDRQTLEPLLTDPRDRQGPGYDVGIGVVYGQVEAEESVLLTEQEYDAVRYRGETYRVDVNGTESVTLKQYVYESSVVAESPAAYSDRVTERYEFELSGLSESERAVVDEARNSTYYTDSTDDEAFETLVERFRGHESVAGNEHGGSWVVRYDGQRYWVDVEYGPFRDEFGTDTSPDATPEE